MLLSCLDRGLGDNGEEKIDMNNDVDSQRASISASLEDTCLVWRSNDSERVFQSPGGENQEPFSTSITIDSQGPTSST